MLGSLSQMYTSKPSLDPVISIFNYKRDIQYQYVLCSLRDQECLSDENS